MSANWNLLGHEWAIDMLKRQIVNGRLRQAYLFTGPAGVGRRTLALCLAQALNCTNPPAPGEFCGECRACHGFARMAHPDLFLLKRQEGDREIKVGAVREVSRGLALTPYEAKLQIALLLNFEEASEEAANALLKTLEEPSASVVICLTAKDADSLPATVVSRCELLRLRPLPIEKLSVALEERLALDLSQARLLASLSGGRPGTAIQMHQDPHIVHQRADCLDAGQQLLAAGKIQRFAYAERVSKERESLHSLLLVWLSFWRDVLLRAGKSSTPLSNPDRAAQVEAVASQLSLEAASRVLRGVERTLEQLSTNVNPRLSMEVLLLNLPNL